MGSAYKDNNDYDNALKYFKEALKYDLENIDCLINIATMHEIKNEYLDSYNFYVRALNINSQSKRAKEGKDKLMKILDEKKITYNH